MFKRFFPVLYPLFVLAIPTPGLAQDIDFAAFSRINDPPLVATFEVTKENGETETQRIFYTTDVSFNGQSVTELKTISINNTVETLIGSAFLTADETTVGIVGSSFAEPTLGEVTLPFSPAIPIPRLVTPGFQLEESRDARVMIGPIPASITVSVSFEFFGLETVTTGLGIFEDALHLRTVRTVSLSGVELLTQDQDEWYHPTVSLFQFKNNSNGNLGIITEIDPPVELPSLVREWSVF